MTFPLLVTASLHSPISTFGAERSVHDRLHQKFGCFHYGSSPASGIGDSRPIFVGRAHYENAGYWAHCRRAAGSLSVYRTESGDAFLRAFDSIRRKLDPEKSFNDVQMLDGIRLE